MHSAWKVSDRSGEDVWEVPKKRRSGMYTLKPERSGRRWSFHCHVAFAPNPWMRRRLDFAGSDDLGIQKWMEEFDTRIVVDWRPAIVKP